MNFGQILLDFLGMDAQGMWTSKISKKSRNARAIPYRKRDTSEANE